jgi:hypothetical protein
MDMRFYNGEEMLTKITVFDLDQKQTKGLVRLVMDTVTFVNNYTGAKELGLQDFLVRYDEFTGELSIEADSSLYELKFKFNMGFVSQEIQPLLTEKKEQIDTEDDDALVGAGQ